MTREIVLDTETTGLDPKKGDRIVEIACIELYDYLPTGRHFHCYINPERDMPAEAEKVHGLSEAFLADKPLFGHADVAPAFLDFIGEASLIAHNAAFDRSFINHELGRAGLDPIHHGRWIDTLPMAQKRFPGLRNSLDALCQRFKISLAEREKHGALIDTKLLAEVYLELCGGREKSLDFTLPTTVDAADGAVALNAYGLRSRPLAPRVTDAERAAHEDFILIELKGSMMWEALLDTAELSPAVSR